MIWNVTTTDSGGHRRGAQGELHLRKCLYGVTAASDGTADVSFNSNSNQKLDGQGTVGIRPEYWDRYFLEKYIV